MPCQMGYFTQDHSGTASVNSLRETHYQKVNIESTAIYKKSLVYFFQNMLTFCYTALHAKNVNEKNRGVDVFVLTPLPNLCLGLYFLLSEVTFLFVVFLKARHNDVKWRAMNLLLYSGPCTWSYWPPVQYMFVLV